jgi:hypothetical protein
MLTSQKGDKPKEWNLELFRKMIASLNMEPSAPEPIDSDEEAWNQMMFKRLQALDAGLPKEEERCSEGIECR